jgi:formiminotetrahydrofolate cyclodeaminase
MPVCHRVEGLPPELPAIAHFAASVQGPQRRASAGAGAALAVALAADLIAQVAERTASWDDRAGTLAQTDVLRERATAAAGRVAAIYHVLVEALEAAIATPAPATGELGEQLARAAEVLIEVAETAKDCAELAVVVARHGDTVVRADATAASILAAAGAEMAAHLVEVNLLASAQRERTELARQLARAAGEHRSAALAVLA